MRNTKIEWCDATWNPVTGCLHGCPYCYARRIAERFSGKEMIVSGTETAMVRYVNRDKRTCAVAELESPQKDAQGKANPYPFAFIPTMHKYRLAEPQKRRKPSCVFVCSMADLFGDWIPDEWISAVFEACAGASWHTYLFLTKNPRRYVELERKGMLPKGGNYWYGSTLASASAELFNRAGYQTFASIEPLTERMSLASERLGEAMLVIIGAETGNRKGRVIPKREWVMEICDAAKQAKVFMKDSLMPIVGEEGMRRELPW